MVHHLHIESSKTLDMAMTFPPDQLLGYRAGLYGCFTRWGDALFELCDAVLCAAGAVASVPSLSLEPEFSRSHGSLYKALAKGRIDEGRLHKLLVESRPGEWPLVFAVDASTWARCDAETSPERGFHYSASKHSAGQPIVAGWSYQWISQLNWAKDSWTAPLDAMRITPAMDATSATIDQVTRLVGLLPSTEEVPLFVFDAGYDGVALADALAGVRCEVLVRISSIAGLPPRARSATRRCHRKATPTRRAIRTRRPSDLDAPDEELVAHDPSYGEVRVRPGAACIQSSTAEDVGRQRASRRSCAAPSSGWKWSTSPNPRRERTRRCGCGGPGRASLISNDASAPTCGDSTSSMHFGS